MPSTTESAQPEDSWFQRAITRRLAELEAEQNGEGEITRARFNSFI